MGLKTTTALRASDAAILSTVLRAEARSLQEGGSVSELQLAAPARMAAAF